MGMDSSGDNQNPKKGKKKLWMPITAVSAIVLIILAAVLLGGGDDKEVFTDSRSEAAMSVREGASPENMNKGGKVAPSASRLNLTKIVNLSFTPITSSFTKTDQNIKAIEINQGISYGIDTNGEFYAINSFVAGRDTIIYVTFSQPVNITNDGKYILYVYRNGEAKRETNFYTSKKLRVLAVPMVNNYSGSVKGCSGEWKNSASHLYANYPIPKDGVEYVLGAELNLSNSSYDLNSDNGMYNVWQALSDLQPKSGGYDLIVGFASKAQMNGDIMGYTYESPAVIVTESSNDREATVSHEVAHTYGIGDEYPDGSLYPPSNMPPYGMSGRNMVTNGRTSGTNPNIKGGQSIGLDESGSIVYKEQRAINLKTGAQLGQVTSYMGWSTQVDSNNLWVTGDIWNHIFKTFTGVNPTGIYLDTNKVVEISTSDYTPPEGGDDNGGDDWDYLDYEDYDEYGDYEDGGYDSGWGTCPECYTYMDPDYIYGECYYCYGLTVLEDIEDFECEECGEYNEFDLDCLVVECNYCGSLSYYACLAAQSSYKVSSFNTTAKQQDINVIEVTGTLFKDGNFEERPWYCFETERSELSTSVKGDYSAVVYDKEGKSLVNVGFKADFVAKSNPPRDIDRVPIDLIIPCPEKAAKISILQGDKELYSQTVSSNMPVVEFTGLTENQKLGNTPNITWKGTYADNDKLWYELWYCPNEEESYLIATDITESSYNVDLTQLPGSNEGYFYLYATDGILTGEIDSPYVKVDFKAPEIITIQDKIPEYKITDEIWFDTEVYDMQDGWLYEDEEIKWYKNGKEYQTGAGLLIWPYELKPGTHKFTMTATNSAGLKESRDYSFTIINDESDLPNDWTRQDVKEAITDGFTVNLKGIDMAVTRLKMAEMMGLIYSYMLEDDVDIYEKYEEGVITDCGDDNMDPWFVVTNGIMQADNGKFNPYGNVTEEEFALAMYRTLYIAAPEFFDNLTKADDILAFYYEVNALDKNENVYNAQQKLTAAKMLVRINRVMKYAFK